MIYNKWVEAMAKGYIYIMTNPALIDIKKLLMQLM